MARFEPTYFNGRWRGNLTEKQCRQLEAIILMKQKKGVIESLKHTIYNLSKTDVDRIKLTHRSFEDSEKTLGTLTDNQTLSLGFSYIAQNCLIGDSVGLGKTVEMSALINLLRKEKYDQMGNLEGLKYLFLTEKTIAPQVQNELIKFTGEYVKLLYTHKQDVQAFRESSALGYDYGIVAPHSMIRQPEFHAWLNDMRGDDKDYQFFDLIIIDESSVLGNVNTLTYKDALKLKEHTKRVICLNATPFESNLQYLYGQLKFLDPSYMPTLTEFRKSFFQYNYNVNGRRQFNGSYKNYEDFKHRVGYRYFYMTRAESGAQIKNVKSKVLTVPLSTEQKRLLRESSMNRMVYDTPSAIDPYIIPNEDNTPKLKLLKQIVTHAGIENGEQVLISVIYKQTQQIIKDYLEELGYVSYILNGDVKKARNSIITKFKTNEIPILITNVQKGLNFGSVKTIVFYGYDPNPSKMINMEGRITRSFNIENKNIFLLSTEGKELETIKTVVAKRYSYTTKFASKDISGVGELLMKEFTE